jgi:hypothetical protein
MKRCFAVFHLLVLLFLFFAVGCETLQTSSTPSSEPVNATSPSPEVTTLFVISDKANIRACPATNCKVIAILKRGDEVIKLSEENDWINIKVKAANREGWVALRLVGKKPKKKTNPDIKAQRPAQEKQKQGSTQQLKEEFSP